MTTLQTAEFANPNELVNTGVGYSNLGTFLMTPQRFCQAVTGPVLTVTKFGVLGQYLFSLYSRNLCCSFIGNVSDIFTRYSGFYGSRDSAVGIATGYRLDDRGVGVRVPVGATLFPSPRRPYRLRGPPNL
jgi:hypothetical protein